MTLEEILKTSGWTDQELSDVAPMLQNGRFRESLEKQYGALVTERDTYAQRDTEWQNLRDTVYQPQISRAEQEAARVRLELAKKDEMINIAKDYGYLTEDQTKEAERKAASAASAAASNYDPKLHPTWGDVEKFADAEGEAIMLAQDLAAEYAVLNAGKSIFEYETNIGGRQLRGMRALRAEAKAAGSRDFETFVQKKFDFQGKRQQLAAARQKEHDDAIAKAAEERVNAEWATRVGSNPNLLVARPSQAPFIPPRASDGKNPWERGTPQQLRSKRITEITQKVLREGRTA